MLSVGYTYGIGISEVVPFMKRHTSHVVGWGAMICLFTSKGLVTVTAVYQGVKGEGEKGTDPLVLDIAVILHRNRLIGVHLRRLETGSLTSQVTELNRRSTLKDLEDLLTGLLIQAESQQILLSKNFYPDLHKGVKTGEFEC